MTLLNIVYQNEDAFSGMLGKAFIISAFIFSIISFILYLSIKKNDKKIIFARMSYLIHWVFIFGAGLILFNLLLNHSYEYEYVWKHSANNLPLKYLISAVWAGQSGSFWLWVFFQGLVGIIVLYTAKNWEKYVMPIIAIGQATLTTMIIGAKVFGFQIGKSPFVLLRNAEVSAEEGFFQNPDYLLSITDGNGINPLLENYWMVIHPPILFIGYSLAIAAFAYAIAGLWKKDFTNWQRPAFIWNTATVLILGIGILLGGAWAYESLTFGGFWAWDPVENASLIPWLIALAALHMLIINRKRKHSYSFTLILSALPFVFVLYSSYLTRSGVLGETSVHAFGNNGLSFQLIAMLLMSITVLLFFIIKEYKNLPKPKKDDFISREFVMNLGVIVLLLSAFQVFATTSVPVYNALFGLNIAPPSDVVKYYNNWQLPFAVIIMILISFSLILKYGKNNFTKFTKTIIIPMVAAIALFIAEVLLFQISEFKLLLFLLFTNFVLTSSIYYFTKNKFNYNNLANTLSHGGFAIFMIGVIVAFSQSEIISKNTSKYDLGDSDSNKENQVLFLDQIKDLGPYHVEYSGKEIDKNHLYYTLDFYKVKDEDTIKEFSVKPHINVNQKMGNVYNPDTYNAFTKDVFTFISYADIDADMMNQEYKSVVNNKEIAVYDTLKMPGLNLKLDSIWLKTKGTNIDYNNIEIIANLSVLDGEETQKSMEMGYIVQDGRLFKKDAFYDDLMFRFEELSQKKNHLVLGVYEKRVDFIVVKSMIFPYISILWIGVIIMFIGLILSILKSLKLAK